VAAEVVFILQSYVKWHVVTGWQEHVNLSDKFVITNTATVGCILTIWWNSFCHYNAFFEKALHEQVLILMTMGEKFSHSFFPNSTFKFVCKTPKLFQCLELIDTMPGVSQMIIIFQGSSSIAMLPGRQVVHLTTRFNNLLCPILSYCLNNNASDRTPRALESGFGPQWKIFFGPPTKGVPARGKLRAKQRAS